MTHLKVALINLSSTTMSAAIGGSVLHGLQRSGIGGAHLRPTRRSTGLTDEPLQTTWARLRMTFIKRAKERRASDFTVDWVHLKLNDQPQRTVLCKDPFKSRDERVEKLIASL